MIIHLTKVIFHDMMPLYEAKSHTSSWVWQQKRSDATDAASHSLLTPTICVLESSEVPLSSISQTGYAQ